MSDAKGNAVSKTVRGYYSLQGDRFVLTSDQKETNVKHIYFGKSGAKWVVGRNQTTRHKDRQVTTYPLKLTAQELTIGGNLEPYEDQHGALWVRRRYSTFELWRLQDGKVTVFTKKEIPSLNGLYPNQVQHDADGSIWFFFSGLAVPKPSALVRFKENQFTLYELNEAVGATARIIDCEGNFWLATTTGLRRLRRTLYHDARC